MIYNKATSQPIIPWLSDKGDKPTKGVHNGSLLIEMDTATTYIFDAENKVWYPFGGKGSGGGGGSSVAVESLTVTENGTTTAPEGTAYNPVTVSVPDPVLETLNVSANGTYTPGPEGSIAGWDEVVVSVPASVPVLQTLTVTENGTYTPESGFNGFDEVEVNVPNRYSASDAGKTVQREITRTISYSVGSDSMFHDGNAMDRNAAYRYVSPTVLTESECSNAAVYCVDDTEAPRYQTVYAVDLIQTSFDDMSDVHDGPEIYRCNDATGAPLFAVVPTTQVTDQGTYQAGIYICTFYQPDMSSNSDRPWGDSSSSDTQIQLLGNHYVLR